MCGLGTKVVVWGTDLLQTFFNYNHSVPFIHQSQITGHSEFVCFLFL